MGKSGQEARNTLKIPGGPANFVSPPEQLCLLHVTQLTTTKLSVGLRIRLEGITNYNASLTLPDWIDALQLSIGWKIKNKAAKEMTNAKIYHQPERPGQWRS